MVVTYTSDIISDPNNTVAARLLFYYFSHDSIANTYTIRLIDSSQFRNGLYGIYRRTKIYYISAGQPRRVLKISVRMTGQLQYSPSAPQDNYDFEFVYKDNTYVPSQLTMTIYGDSAATMITSKQTQDVTDPSMGGSYEAGGLDILHFTHSEPARTPILEYNGGCCILDQYTDSSYEVVNITHDYTNLFFYGLGVDLFAPLSSLYTFNKSHFFISMVTDIITPGDDTVTNQRKIDFTYSASNSTIYSLFDITGIPENLYWEQVCEYAANVYAKWGWNNDYSFIDPYIADPYMYYQDICDSYTDSLFVHNKTSTRQLISHAVYTNTIIKGADGNITRIIKTDESGNVLRNIEIGY